MVGIEERFHSQLIHLLSAQPRVRRAILFGSRARGDAAERADVDLAIDAPAATIREWMDLVGRIEEMDTLLPVDIVKWDEAPEMLRDRIESEGQIVYERRN